MHGPLGAPFLGHLPSVTRSVPGPSFLQTLMFETPSPCKAGLSIVSVTGMSNAVCPGGGMSVKAEPSTFSPLQQAVLFAFRLSDAGPDTGPSAMVVVSSEWLQPLEQSVKTPSNTSNGSLGSGPTAPSVPL